jgi:hypothetical protein
MKKIAKIVAAVSLFALSPSAAYAAPPPLCPRDANTAHTGAWYHLIPCWAHGIVNHPLS